jgi:tetratricopeptide (TPR) repeat protein
LRVRKSSPKSTNSATPYSPRAVITPLEDEREQDANVKAAKQESFSKKPHDDPNQQKSQMNTKNSQNSTLNSSKRYHISKKSAGTTTSIVEMVDELEDPVMALFHARNTQKVRFCLDENGNKDSSSGGHDQSTINNYPKEGRPSTVSSCSTTAHRLGVAAAASFNIKNFMKGSIFGSGNNKKTDDDFELELQREMKNLEHDWEEAPEILQTRSGRIIGASHEESEARYTAEHAESFTEDPETRKTVMKLLNKARRAQYLHYRYSYAVKCYVRVLEILKEAEYPSDHPTLTKTMECLQAAHFCETSYRNSANIVKLGIKYEDQGDLVRALKMYTIAYRIRRDNLSSSHPSLVVLLNMLGSIQIKRGELDEAMAIYELALKDANVSSMHNEERHHATKPSTQTNRQRSQQQHLQGSSLFHISSDDDSADGKPLPTNLLTRAVSYREMGSIHEQWGEIDQALLNYHKSLSCLAEYKGIVFEPDDYDDHFQSTAFPLDDMQHSRSPDTDSVTNTNNEDHSEDADDFVGGMEMTLEKSHKKGRKSHRVVESTSTPSASPITATSIYDVFFPLEQKKRRKFVGLGKDDDKKNKQKGDQTDIDVALTIHKIAQLHRSEEEYHLALPAFYVALRGMKHALGKSHPNVAAILGNIGNLQKEMGDMDSAYSTYQQVLAIESYRLGLSHPDVVVTLHNIATIDASRGNHDHALSLYMQVIGLQRKLFGEDHESVAVTSACMGDVYERLGDSNAAVECYEEALRIKIAALGRHSLEVARLLHKLGKLEMSRDDFHMAQSYISKANLVYRLNKLAEDDEWVVDVHRDAANIDAAIAFGRGVMHECEC